LVNPSPLLEVDRLSAGYGDICVVADASFAVGAGETLALVGANAAGKSTLLLAIMGSATVLGGSVRYRGEPIAGLPAHLVAERGLTLVPEGRALFPFMTVRENLELGASRAAARPHRAHTMERVFSLLPRLRERQSQLAHTLSGGEQQMCAIGRGLMARPELLILDEPSLGLAPMLVLELFELLRRLRNEGIAILLIEQHVRHALELADSGLVMDNGRIVLRGSGTELLREPGLRSAYLGSG
jgi:branched-chain amino acid transport system ATP-binding protein